MKTNPKRPAPDVLPVLPHNYPAERQVLAAILLQASGYEQLFDILKPESFYDSRHELIFKKLRSLREQTRTPNLLNLYSAGESELDIAYGASLIDAAPLTEASGAAELVVETRKLREIMHAAHTIGEMAKEYQQPAEAISEQAIELFNEIGFDIRNTADLGLTYQEAGIDFVDSIGKRTPRIFTDIAELDERTGGFHPGELIIFTAETGTGKTVLAQQTRRRSCQQGFHTLYCSGEMLARHLISRELASVSGVKHWKMRNTERITPPELAAIVEAISHECTHCRILDGQLSLTRIRRAARQMKKRSGLDCIVIDYDELVEVPGKDEFEQQRHLAREAKSLGMELVCPVILISQLRKALQGEDRKHPTLQRLYGSGAKAKHSSIVLYVDRTYVQDLKGDETAARIVILKSRDGRVGQLEAKFDVQKLRFSSVVKEGS